MGYSIAIDGPAGAGKSTIARKAASKLSFIYVDTGAMYRALALFFIRKGLAPGQTDQIEAACREAKVSISYQGGEQQVLLNGENVTGLIRSEEVGKMASASSANQVVRLELLELQRDLARNENVIMDGRDIGTHVLPGADIKIYLTASVKARAMRRYKELADKGEAVVLEAVEKDIRERDQRDMTREIAPLKQAEDAILIDSSQLGIEAVVEQILDIYRSKNREG